MNKRQLITIALSLYLLPALANQGPRPVPADAAIRIAVIAELSSQLNVSLHP